MNEAVADLVAVQLAGGSNRFLTAAGAIPAPGMPGFPEVFCRPGNPLCVEDNMGSPVAVSPPPLDPFDARVATELTRLHDVFDGSPEIAAEVMHNGGVWLVDATGLLPGTVSFVPGDDAGDDQVLLMGGLFSVVDAWVDAPDGLFDLSVVNFYRGVTRQARIESIPDGTLCAAYALHEPVPGCLLAFFP
jgi:hypothetical protein